MKRTLYCLLTLLLILLVSVSALAQLALVPALMNFQGRLTKPDGTPIADGTYSIRFSLHDALSGGNEKWNQTLGTVAVKNGTFAVLLSGFPANTFAGNLWLEIKIGSDAPLTPRQQLVSVAYAMKAGSVSDNAITSASIVDGSLTGADLANGSLTADKFADGLFSPAWLLGGNSGTNGSQFVGTTDNQPLVFKVNNQRALQMQYVANGDWHGNNLLGGYWLNSVTNGVVGATLLGGIDYGGTALLNRVTDHGGTVSGGVANAAGNDNTNLEDAYLATVGGGAFNTASGDFATVGGGEGNTVSGSHAFVGGGLANTASGGYSTVSGGKNNKPLGDNSTVGGGQNNTAGGSRTTVAGGSVNLASADDATVAGGYNNMASGLAATVGGGTSNIASGILATVGGGTQNTAGGSYATVGGGDGNTAGGGFGVVPGGWRNSALGRNSFAAGRSAKANHDGAFVWADNHDDDFASTTTDQFNVRASGGVRIYSNSGISTGVLLAAGTGSWSSASDRNLKTSFQPVDVMDILEKLAVLPLTTWNYKANASIRHIGVMAQDFHVAFGGLGVDDKHIDTVDADGVAFAAIQGLYRKVKGLEAENAELKARLDALAEAVAELKASRK